MTFNRFRIFFLHQVLKTLHLVFTLVMISTTSLCMKNNVLYFQTKLSSVKCPNHASRCHDGNTCCLMKSGEYGCCPKFGAVCCSDKIHCCPHGHFCDVNATFGRCNSNATVNKQTSLDVIQPAVSQSKVSYILASHRHHNIHPDGYSPSPEVSMRCPRKERKSCGDYMTCCKMQTYGFGCCPLPRAVCCPSEDFCCAYGYDCDASEPLCNRRDGNVSIEKISLLYPALEMP